MRGAAAEHERAPTPGRSPWQNQECFTDCDAERSPKPVSDGAQGGGPGSTTCFPSAIYLLEQGGNVFVRAASARAGMGGALRAGAPCGQREPLRMGPGATSHSRRGPSVPTPAVAVGRPQPHGSPGWEAAAFPSPLAAVAVPVPAVGCGRVWRNLGFPRVKGRDLWGHREWGEGGEGSSRTLLPSALLHPLRCHGAAWGQGHSAFPPQLSPGTACPSSRCPAGRMGAAAGVGGLPAPSSVQGDGDIPSWLWGQDRAWLRG